MATSGYQYVLYRHSETRQYWAGEAVYVWLKSQYSTGRAVVLATPDSLPADSPFAGRYLVRFIACGSTAHVRPERLLPVYQQQHALQQAAWQQQSTAQLPPSQQEAAAACHQQQAPTLPKQQQDQAHPSMVQLPQQDLRNAVQQLAVSEDYQTASVLPDQQQDHCQQHQQQQQQQRQLPEQPAQHQPEQQQQQKGLVLLVYDTVDYRRLARSQVQASDGVLELGCSYGVCSKMLQEHAAWLVGVDNSEACITESRKRSPQSEFYQVDVLEQQNSLLQLAGCYACRNNISTDAADSVVGCAACTSSSGSSNGISCGACAGAAADASTAGVQASSSSNGSCDGAPAACSCEGTVRSRNPPCSVVFADIGGNRQLQSLVKLVPWVLRAIRPRLLVVKSEELAAAAEQQLADEAQQQQQQQKTHRHATGPQESAAAAAAADPRSSAASAAAAAPQAQFGVSSLQECDGVIADVASWWQQLEQQCGNPASLAEPWFIAARAAGFTKNPMRYPQRCIADGTRICRPHNYDKHRGCMKQESCPFDHRHCHHCLRPDHRAVDCPVH